MHEEKKGRGWKEHDTRSHYRAGHCPSVVPATTSFNCAKRDFISGNQLDVVDVYVQLSGATHSPLMLSFSNSGDSHSAMLNYNHVANLYIF
jgi:hypothetical protein